MDEQKNKEELLKAVVDVLEEAFAEVDKLRKQEAAPVVEPTAQVEPPKVEAAAPQADVTPEVVKTEEPKELKVEAAPLAKDDAPKPDKDKDKDKEDEDEDEEDDEKLMDAYKSMTKRLLEKGLIKTESAQTPDPIVKTEEPKQDQSFEDLRKAAEDFRKSTDDKIDSLAKAVQDIAKTVEKLAEAPAPRRGLNGLKPLRKHDQQDSTVDSLSKGEIVAGLLRKRESGDRRVDTNLIARAEMGKLSQGDYERINGILS